MNFSSVMSDIFEGSGYGDIFEGSGYGDIFEESGYGDEEKNTTLTCAASSLQAESVPEVSPSTFIAFRVTIFIYGGIMLTLGTFLNLLIVYLIAKFREVRNTSFYIAIQIVMADLCLIFMHIPSFANHYAGHWVLGEYFCIASAIVIFLTGTVRISLVLVFAFDRFAIVFAPFNYPKYSHKVTIILCALCWCYSVAMSLIMSPPLLDCYILFDTISLCSYYHGCNKKCQIFHYFLLVSHSIPVIIIPLVFFVALYIKGIRIRCKDSAVLGTSNRSMTRQDLRATKTFLLLFLFAILLPAISLLVIDHFPNFFIARLSNGIIYLIFITDPITILCNGDAKEALRKLLKQLKTSIQGGNFKRKQRAFHSREREGKIEATSSLL